MQSSTLREKERMALCLSLCELSFSRIAIHIASYLSCLLLLLLLWLVSVDCWISEAVLMHTVSLRKRRFSEAEARESECNGHPLINQAKEEEDTRRRRRSEWVCREMSHCFDEQEEEKEKAKDEKDEGANGVKSAYILSVTCCCCYLFFFFWFSLPLNSNNNNNNSSSRSRWSLSLSLSIFIQPAFSSFASFRCSSLTWILARYASFPLIYSSSSSSFFFFFFSHHFSFLLPPHPCAIPWVK